MLALALMNEYSVSNVCTYTCGYRYTHTRKKKTQEGGKVCGSIKRRKKNRSVRGKKKKSE